MCPLSITLHITWQQRISWPYLIFRLVDCILRFSFFFGILVGILSIQSLSDSLSHYHWFECLKVKTLSPSQEKNQLQQPLFEVVLFKMCQTLNICIFLINHNSNINLLRCRSLTSSAVLKYHDKYNHVLLIEH